MSTMLLCQVGYLLLLTQIQIYVILGKIVFPMYCRDIFLAVNMISVISQYVSALFANSESCIYCGVLTDGVSTGNVPAAPKP